MSGADTVVLFGGTSSERRVSVASAQHIAAYLPRAEFWFQSPEGAVAVVDVNALTGMARPFEVDFVPLYRRREWGSLELALDELKAMGAAAFLGFHGGDGENGVVQALLETRQIPFTGSAAAASRLAFDKVKTKACVEKVGVRVAPHVLLGADELRAATFMRDMAGRFEEWGGLVLKPVRDGSSMGLHVVRRPSELAAAIFALAGASEDYVAESLVVGREMTVGVVGVTDERGEPVPLPASEVRATAADATFDYQGKYLGRGVVEITPAEISAAEMHAVQSMALKAHRAVGAYGYTRCDMILTRDGPVFLEINTLPGLTRASFIPQQLSAAGIGMGSFIANQIALARARK